MLEDMLDICYINKVVYYEGSGITVFKFQTYVSIFHINTSIVYIIYNYHISCLTFGFVTKLCNLEVKNVYFFEKKCLKEMVKKFDL